MFRYSVDSFDLNQAIILINSYLSSSLRAFLWFIVDYAQLFFGGGGLVTALIAIRVASLRRECRENSDFSSFDLSDRAPSPTKKKEEEKNKLRVKEKSGGPKEVADKARGREKTRTRHSASSGSSRSADAVMLHVCILRLIIHDVLLLLQVLTLA